MYVPLSLFRLDNHIIHIHLYLVMNYIVLNGRDCPLESSPRIFQPEWHNLITVGALMRSESYFLLIFGFHENLIVIGESIHK